MSYGWVLIPFYKDPMAEGYRQSVEYVKALGVRATSSSDLRLALVDDGARLEPQEFQGIADLLDQVPASTGKAAAIRRGLRRILAAEASRPVGIVQFDGDQDQSPADVRRLLHALLDLTGGDLRTPALVIGQRYHERMVPPARPESIPYRQALIIFLRLIAGRLGFAVDDWVSGARAYTSEYALRFVEESRADGYGVEAEQLVVARIRGATVRGLPLTYGNPRAPQTKAAKWLQTLQAFLLHAEQLDREGMADLLGVVTELSDQIAAAADEFDLDLTPLGDQSRVHFQRHGADYTASVPAETRLRHFQGLDSFAMADRR